MVIRLAIVDVMKKIVRRTIMIDENTDKKIRDRQADAIKFTNHAVSYSQIINLLLEMTLEDKTKMETIDTYFSKIIERKSR